MPKGKVAAVGECVEWTGAKHHKGYGQWTPPADENGKRNPWFAHRLLWTVLIGPIPQGKQVNHHCDNRICVNTDHLYLGSQAENMADRSRRNRQSKGESVGSAKLTEADIRAIRADGRTQRSIAADYGIGQSQVNRIKNRKNWQHLA